MSATLQMGGFIQGIQKFQKKAKGCFTPADTVRDGDDTGGNSPSPLIEMKGI
ncbi:hypothetical protein [Dickeya chrysanthemi]|uniref:hypothetical protein n=1 Tax=Dickeya chrysanthemi TaxID=556 RepID=UPI0030179B42